MTIKATQKPSLELTKKNERSRTVMPEESQIRAKFNCTITNKRTERINNDDLGVTQVCKGDRLLVDVTNGLASDTTTIHWHGLHQRGSPFMDGVPYIGQCPILPGQTFHYEFLADSAGSFLWHSHSGI